jgi:hypothetical protein
MLVGEPNQTHRCLYPALTEAMKACPDDPIPQPLLSAAERLVAKLAERCDEHND